MLSNFSVKKPYTIVVAVIILAILGTVSFTNMTTDLLPSLNLPYAVISTTYIGASPEEVESVVTRSIEQSMASLSNIKNISSISRENMSLVILEFTASANMDTVFIEMRESLDMIMAFMPDEVGTPIMLKLNPDMMPVMVLSVAVEDMEIGQSSQLISNNIIHEFESVEGVASVSTSGLVDNDIHIIIREEKIQEVNNQIMQMMAGLGPMGQGQAPQVAINRELVSGILKGQNFSMPAGYITEDGIDYLVRAGDRINDIDQLKELVVMQLPIPGAAPITIEDVADVVVTDNSDTMYTKLNGNDAVILTIQKQSEYSTSDVASRVRDRIEQVEQRNEGVEIVALMDQGVYIDIVVGSISSNLIIGGILAVLILLLFLRDIRPTIVVGFAIPVSLVTALVMMYFSNVTLNIISMGGLALGVGMLVDNSIVVIENIYRMRGEGKSAKEAAVEGAKEVSGAIAASTLTTISVFAPILFTQGITRELFTDMGLTIAYSLVASLLIALTLVPMMASTVITKEVKREEKKLDAVKAWYTKVLEFSLRRKWIVILTVIALFITSIVGAFSMGTEFFPASDTGQLMVNIRMPEGSTLDETADLADEVMEIVRNVQYVDNVGGSIGGGMGMGFMGGGGNVETVSIYVLVDEDNVNKSGDIIRQIREKTEHFEAEISIGDSGADMGAMMGGGGISVSVSGRNFDTLESVAGDIANIVSSVEGTMEVFDGIDRTEPEIRVIVDKEKSIAHGLTVAQVFMEINGLLRNASVDTTITVGNIDYDITVKDEESMRDITRKDIEDLMLATPQGGTVSILDIASIEEASGYGSIRRENQQRVLTVTAELEDGYNIGLVSREIQRLLSDYNSPDGYTVKMGGEQEAINSAFRDLFLMLALAIAFIYLIMVAQFQSLLSPFIVMFTIPLAFTGGFFGLILTGSPVSIVAFIGLIILTGVVVNNGIVFIDYINILRDQGMSKKEAIIKAGNVRLRPIIMTALTTIIALSTMSLGVGTGTEMIQPMAITAIGGLIYATLLTLIFIPVLYDIMNKKEKHV